MKDNGHAYKSYLNNYFLTDLLNMAMVGFSDYRGECKTCARQLGTMEFFMLTDL
jgi:hypothetical protein